MAAVVDALLDSITPGNLSNDTLLAFGLLLSPQTVTAALDLVETHAVMRWKNAWGRITHYTVSGTSQTYLVNLTLPNYKSTQPNIPRTEGDPPNMLHPLTMGDAQWSPDWHQPLAAFCTCPAFAYTIMLAPHGSRSTPLMCKHILAARIAERMERVSEQTASDDADFEQLACYI